MKYKKFDILNKATYSHKTGPRNVYCVDVECDANDGDYMNSGVFYGREEFRGNELLMLVLSYVSVYTGRFIDESEDSWRNGYYGHYVAENEDFPWLDTYLSEENLLCFAGMIDAPCHSISNVEITYYDSSGSTSLVELPSVDDLFEDKEEFVQYLNELYKNEYE